MLPVLGSILKKHGIEALVSSENYSISTLLSAAQKAKAEGIFLINEDTLQNCVQTNVKTNATLDNFRGSRLNFSVPVIVGAPLQQMNTIPYAKFIADIDISKFAHLKKKPLQLPFTVCKTILDFTEMYTFLAACIIISHDVETMPIKNSEDVTIGCIITCCSFTGLARDGRTTKSFVIPFYDWGLPHWKDATIHGIAINYMQKVLACGVPKLMFQATYDAQYDILYHAYPNNLTLDALGLQHSIYSELPKTLAFTASMWCYDYYYWKYEAALAQKNKDIRAYWGYCAKDSWFTLRCLLSMFQSMPEYAVKNYQMLFKLTYPYLYCAFEGWLVDNQARDVIDKEAQGLLDTALADLRIMTNCNTFNPGSAQQVGSFLYDVIGAKVIKKSKKTGAPSTDEKTLLRLSEQHPLIARIVDDVLKYRGEAKALSTYFHFDQLNNRLMYSVSPFGAETARSASRASNFYVGTQIQNIPSYAKGMLVADEGYTLIEPDYSKSEAWCVAYIHRCSELKKVLANKDKEFYKSLGTLFFGIPYEEVTKEMRNEVLKRIVHASNYMMGVKTLIENAGVPKLLVAMQLIGWKGTDLEAFAKHLIETYHKPFPEIRKGYIDIKREILRTNRLFSFLGYTRFFFGDIINDHKILRGAVAHAPQNLSVTILNRGLWNLYKLCIASEGAFRLKAQIHDSTPGQIRTDLLEKYKPRIMEALTQSVIVHGETLTIPVEWKQGQSWLSCA